MVIVSSEMLSECESKSLAVLSLVTVQKVPLSLTRCQAFSNLIGRQSQVGSQAGVVDINHAFHLYYNVVCGSSFSQSQLDFEGFLRALRT